MYISKTCSILAELKERRNDIKSEVDSCCYHMSKEGMVTYFAERQIKGYIDKDVFLLTVEDPKQDVGSGGATINALLTVLTTDILKDARILILHNAERSEDRCNKSVMELDGAKYTASFWEKSKQLSEQAAAIFGLTLLRKEDGRKPDVTSPNDDVADAWSRHFRSRDIHV
ncbi:FCSK-like protein [Mya arenaria]|uniref:FCSK-like protein n=1 Tax=Mya arenaria TaxID=6604 RepID=A0ABY7ERB0_MYAAR|nr:FCSK-like protein [Mya arenaria]